MPARSISARLVARAIAGGSLLLSAYLVAVGVGALTQEAPALRDAKDARGPAKRKLRQEPEPEPALLGQQILARNIFDSQTGSIPWEPERAQGPAADALDDEGAPEWVDCPPELRLLASVVYPDSERSFVSVRAGTESQLLHVGDVLTGAELTAIEPSYAYFRLTSGSSCALPLYSSGPPAPRLSEAPMGKQGRPAAFAASDLDDGITELGAGRYQVSGSLAERARANGGTAIVQGVKFQPRTRKGKVVGMRVKQIREDSLLYRLGVRDGDLLRTVNGFELSGAEGLLSAYAALQDKPSLSLSISRKGKVQNLQYLFE